MSQHRDLHRISTHDETARRLKTGWTDILLICRKCSKKLNGGFGEDGQETLRRAVRNKLRETGQRGQFGVIETACMGVCPNNAVTTVRANAPGIFSVIPKGTPTDKVLF
jgi:predicted metal-binding protein